MKTLTDLPCMFVETQSSVNTALCSVYVRLIKAKFEYYNSGPPSPCVLTFILPDVA